MRKNPLFLFLLLVLLCSAGCASHKKINELAREIDCNKTIHFIWNEESNAVKIERKGYFIGNSTYPDYKKTFQKSIEELNQHTTSNLVYKGFSGFPSDNVKTVKALIKNITWTFGVFSALMETEIIYQIDGKEINITGTNKVYHAGTKKGNLFKSLKHGHYQLLKYNICQ